MRRLLVLDVVGLTPKHLRGAAKSLGRLAADGFAAPLRPVFPAVTCSVQSTFVTGRTPTEHGIVGNGWYFRDLAEVWLWRQSNRLVHGDKVWHEAKARDPAFTCANLFWWYAMAGDFDAVVTPRPAYHADGRKSPDVWTDPAELKPELNAKLGRFPLFEFWGPRAGLPSSQWIADAAAHVLSTRSPTLAFVYLPHLDYDLQRFDPDDPRSDAAVAAIDGVASRLIDHARGCGYDVLVLSEYGITPVTDAVPINRILREAGFLRAQDNLVGELLDVAVSRAFAVADHQCAHVYVREARDVPAVKALLETTQGIERVLDARGKAEFGIDHDRSGELVAISEPDRWFSYPWWLDDANAPDFARTVDIHKKPGYDPLELMLDPKLPAPKLKVAWTLLKKALGFRYLLDVVPLDTRLIRGSHGRLPERDDDGPVLIGSDRRFATGEIAATAVRKTILDHLFAAG
ncbi:MAG: alkaline phosphatase family protein [Planctomycetes bacterium]|nr:alkaline phosphatase family protein [Planctomycetota bacterium]